MKKLYLIGLFCQHFASRYLCGIYFYFYYDFLTTRMLSFASSRAQERPHPLSLARSLSRRWRPNCQTNLVIAIYTLYLFFCKLINTTAYYLGRYEPSSPVSCHAPRCSTSFIQSLNHTFTLTLSLSLSSTVSRGLSPSLVGFLFPLTLTTNNRISSLLEFTTLRHSLVHIPIWAPLSLSLTPTSLSVCGSVSFLQRKKKKWMGVREKAH